MQRSAALLGKNVEGRAVATDSRTAVRPAELGPLSLVARSIGHSARKTLLGFCSHNSSIGLLFCPQMYETVYIINCNTDSMQDAQLERFPTLANKNGRISQLCQKECLV